MSRWAEFERRLNSFSEAHRKAIIKYWIADLSASMQGLSRQISPFKGQSKKSAFGSNPDKKDSDVLTIWGARPNIGGDPAKYPQIPSRSREKGDRYRRIWLKPLGIFRQSNDYQVHWRGNSLKAYNSNGAKWIYSLPDRRYGARVYGVWGDGSTAELYSIRSIVQLIKDYQGLDEIIESSFKKAVLRARTRCES